MEKNNKKLPYSCFERKYKRFENPKELLERCCRNIKHSHKQNEEIYVILSGKGKAVIDDETVELKAGDWIRISPEGKRQFSAADDEAISFACIQVKAGSLEGYTAADAVM
ncbi:MAG: cupin domain-containing protein [Eubacteriales bacterium]|nr:cupin domain-containing protein [Eubacteriales bacterium]